MLAILRRVLVLVTIVAFAGGMTVQATPSAAALGLSSSSEADTGCHHMATHHPGKQSPMSTRGTETARTLKNEYTTSPTNARPTTALSNMKRRNHVTPRSAK